MDTKEPAFPVSNDANIDNEKGITLRDYFAGQALIGLLSTGDGIKIDGEQCFGKNAMVMASYAYADAMLSWRSKKGVP